jgi:Domain of unknown function (DUF5122) beta-propeller
VPRMVSSKEFTDVLVQPDGKILVGLAMRGTQSSLNQPVIRLNANGTLDQAFQGNATHAVNGLALQADGRVVAAGADASGNPEFMVDRYTTGG